MDSPFQIGDLLVYRFLTREFRYGKIVKKWTHAYDDGFDWEIHVERQTYTQGSYREVQLTDDTRQVSASMMGSDYKKITSYPELGRYKYNDPIFDF